MKDEFRTYKEVSQPVSETESDIAQMLLGDTVVMPDGWPLSENDLPNDGAK